MWIINDLNVANRVYEFISPEALSSLYERCEKYDDFEYIYVAKGDTEFLRVCKSVFGWIDYEPDEWNPYPTFKPPRSGSYLVYLNGRFENRINAAYYNTDYRNWDTYSDASVLAFRELEIEPPGEDVLKISRAARE